MTSPIEDRFAAKVDTSGDCWLWLGALNPKGYGRFRVAGFDHQAHRWAYESAYGPFDRSLQVDHMCRTRNCVRPEHLRLVTNKQNCENQGSRGASGVRGVSRDRNRWRVAVWHNYTAHSGGSFGNLADARDAAIALRKKLFTHSIEVPAA